MAAVATITTVEHPYITAKASVAGGKAVITGTRIKVTQIALEYERLGWSPDQIVEAHPHLTLAQVHDALSFYYGHQAQLDAEIKAEAEKAAEIKSIYTPKLPSHVHN